MCQFCQQKQSNAELLLQQGRLISELVGADSELLTVALSGQLDDGNLALLLNDVLTQFHKVAEWQVAKADEQVLLAMLDKVHQEQALWDNPVCPAPFVALMGLLALAHRDKGEMGETDHTLWLSPVYAGLANHLGNLLFHSFWSILLHQRLTKNNTKPMPHHQIVWDELKNIINKFC